MKSIGYYPTPKLTPEQAAWFDGLNWDEQLELSVALSQLALDGRNRELDRPLNLSIINFPPGSIELSEVEIPYQ